jgi:hypothetical protein
VANEAASTLLGPTGEQTNKRQKEETFIKRQETATEKYFSCDDCTRRRIMVQMKRWLCLGA